MRISWAILAIMLVGMAAGAYAQPTAIQKMTTSTGQILTDQAGMTLYINRNDPSGRSVCVGNCAIKWPPLLASAQDNAVGEYSVLSRKDGTKQWAFRGQPLYRWVLDMEPGQTTGDGVGGVWKVARP